jgi:uncharacterized membrane protein
MLNKLAKNIVAIISIAILAVFIIMSLLYIVTVKNFFENVFINLTTSVGLFVYLVIDLLFIIILKLVSLKVNKNKKIKIIEKVLIGAFLIIYTIISINWIKNSNIEPIDDSKSVNDLAVSFANR